jgi:NADH-quinone oxidoreductase subunit L
MKKDMGGLWRKMPVSFWSWIAATAALCGVPLFSGFFSKDEIIDSAKHYEYTTLWIVSVVGAGMTAAYMIRATYLTWFGEPRGGAAHFMGVAHDDHDEVHGHSAHPTEAEHADGHLPDDDVHRVAHGKPLPFAPHDSPWKLTAPIMILAILAVGSGYLNAPAFDIYWFEHQTESSIGLPIDHGDEGAAEGGEEHEDDAAAVTEFASGGFPAASADGDEAHHYEAPGEFQVPAPPTFTWSAAIWPGLTLVAFGAGLSAMLSLAVFGRRRNVFSPLVGLTRRSRPIGALHTFLVNKLYLDHLYERVITRGIAHPISKAAYWFNQRVIDGIVDGAGRSGKRTGDWVYRNIDQRVVDGAVNASGMAASEGGHALQPVQSGKVNQYGALLFGAAAVGAIVLILTNV